MGQESQVPTSPPDGNAEFHSGIQLTDVPEQGVVSGAEGWLGNQERKTPDRLYGPEEKAITVDAYLPAGARRESIRCKRCAPTELT